MNAGVTKHFDGNANLPSEERNEIEENLCCELRKDITRLSFLADSKLSAKSLSLLLERMDISELSEMKCALAKDVPAEFHTQTKSVGADGNASFKL